MQQYIYGNLEHKGYRYLASEPELLKDPSALGAMAPFAYYDHTSSHGELDKQRHRSYWMATVDLDAVGRKRRLIFQASGYDPHRTAFFAQGYMGDRDARNEDYGPEFLKLLKAEFGDSRVVDIAGQGAPEAVALDSLPVDETLAPARLEKDLLGRILRAVLENKKVFLRLPAAGAEAMRQSRELLLAIYERLPYERRRVTGFFTGATAPAISAIRGKLSSIAIFLIDGDTELTQGAFSDGDLGISLAAAPGGTLALAETGGGLPRDPLIDFLTEAPLPELEKYFRFCLDYGNPALTGPAPGLAEYRLLLEGFRPGTADLTQEEIRDWARALIVYGWDPLRKKLYKVLAKRLSESALQSYLLNFAGEYGDLWNWTLPRSYPQTHRDAPRHNALRLAQALENAGLAAEGLPGHFAALACRAYPCLTEKQPTEKTLWELNQVPLPEASQGELPLTARIKDQVRLLVQQKQEAQRAEYQRQFREQKASGNRQIEAWSFGAGQELEALYALLRAQHYLHEELFPAGVESPNWNEGIAQRLIHSLPQALEDQNLRPRVERGFALFQREGGLLTGQQRQVKEAWDFAVEQKLRDRVTLPELQALWGELEELRNFRRGQREPRLAGIFRVQVWAARRHEQNTELMLLLAKKRPELRAFLIPRLARTCETVAAEDIQELYLSGCTKAQLWAAAGKETSKAWKRAVDKVFPTKKM